MNPTFFDKQTAAEETSTSQEKVTQAATTSSTETKTMVEIEKKIARYMQMLR